jgi:hypothetical protein
LASTHAGGPAVDIKQVVGLAVPAAFSGNFAQRHTPARHAGPRPADPAPPSRRRSQQAVDPDLVDAVLIVGDDIATPGLAEDEGIRATAAGDPVVATTTVETIRAMAANDDIVGRRASADFLISQETRMAL